MWSTAGDQSSAAMIDYRETALAQIDRGESSRSYFAEWSMPAGVVAEEYWGYANPALGTTVTVEALRAAAGKDGFLRAHLNQWITARGAWLDPGVWEKLQTDRAMPAGGILAIDSSVDESRYVGVRAAMHGDQVIVELAFQVDTEQAMWDLVVQAAQADRTLHLAVTPTLELHLPPELNRRFHSVGYGELLRYTSLVRSMIQEGRVRHRGSALLAEHVTRAVGVRTAQGYVMSSQKSPGPIEAARVAVWAIALVSKPQSKQRPTLVVAG
jgi:phage terminase large subunit-like protein